jgi:undecaprenyl diphosphate synthase
MSDTHPIKPRHIAIIMDGNNRWAKAHGLPGVAGHRAGVKSVRAIVEACGEENIQVLTLFAFSSENWQRPPLEVRALMDLFLNLLQREVKKLHASNVRLVIIGDRARFSDTIQENILKAEKITENNTGLVLVIAANYGGQWDIVQATQRIAQRVADKEITPAEINQEMLQANISLGELPPVDLCIRTSGEQRISNFLLWQIAYAELYFTPLYWPDFRAEQLKIAIDDYSQRQRRFGGRLDNKD